MLARFAGGITLDTKDTRSLLERLETSGEHDNDLVLIGIRQPNGVPRLDLLPHRLVRSH